MRKMMKICLGEMSEKCILFFCGPFLHFFREDPFSRSVYYFLWSIFALFGHFPIFDRKKTFSRSVYYLFSLPILLLDAIFSGPFLHLKKIKTFSRSVYYFFAVHFCTFWRKTYLPEVYTIFSWSIFAFFDEKPILQMCILSFVVHFCTFWRKTHISEVGGVRATLVLPRTGKSISIALAFALRACVRASEAACARWFLCG